MCLDTNGLERARITQAAQVCSIMQHCSVCLHSLKIAAINLRHPPLDAAMLVGPFCYAEGLVNMPCIDDKLHQPSLSPSVLTNIHHYMQEEMTVLLPQVHA